MAKGERLQGYAPGNYFCTCTDCGIEFQGDKRAQQCQVCALRAELAAERDKREEVERQAAKLDGYLVTANRLSKNRKEQAERAEAACKQKQRQCEFYSAQCNAALAACEEKDDVLRKVSRYLVENEGPVGMTLRIAVQAALSTDAGRAYAERCERYQSDSERLAFVFSLTRHSVKDLIDIEMRLLNDDEPTMDEVRNAIDAAMASAKALQAAAKAEDTPS